MHRFLANNLKLINTVVIFCTVLLLVLFTIPLFVFDSSLGWWLMQSFPLLVILPQLHKDKRRPLQWLGFLVLFYFAAGVLQVFSPVLLQRWLGSLTIICASLLFVIIIVKLPYINSKQERLHVE